MRFNLRDNASDDTLEFSTLKWKKRTLVIWSIVGICALFYVLGFVLDVLSMPVSIIVWCVVLVFCLRPIVDGLEKRGVGRALGTLIAFIALVAGVTVLALMLFLPGVGASSQFMDLSEKLPGYVQGLEDAMSSFAVQYAEVLQNATVQQWFSQAADSLSAFLGNFANAAGVGIVGLGTFLANTAMIIGFALVISFWILMELPGLAREMRRLVRPEKLDDYEMLTGTVGRVIGGYIKATLVQCFIIGVACGIGYAILGLPGPAALGIITGLLNIIPVVGPWIGGFVAGIVGFTVSPFAALLAIAVSVAVQQVVYTFISPMLMSDSVDIHPALVIFGLTCGSAIGTTMAGLSGGILGMLASIPVIAATKAIFVYYYERNTGRRIVAPDGVLFKGEVGDDAYGFSPSLDAAAPSPKPSSSVDNRILNTQNRDRDLDEQRREIRERMERQRQNLEHPRDVDSE